MRNTSSIPGLRIALISSVLSCAALAKDTPVSLDKCPAPVQAVVRQYSANATMEEIALDQKKKSGGPPVYEAKFILRDGKRIELHISPDGRVLQVENKAPKP